MTSKVGRIGRSLLLLVLAISITGLLYGLALEEEPFHIDELRQTSSYDRTWVGVADAAFAQDQPPLDPLLNAALQRLIGVGDWKQRLLPAIAGVAAIGTLGWMTLRSGLQQGASVLVLTMTGTALLTSVFVYARPYAIPFLLMMGFLAAANRWLTNRSRWAAALLYPLALLLPLSRTLEPLLILVSTSAVLLTFRYLRGRQFAGTVWLPITAAVAGAVVTGLPVISRLRSELAVYTGSSGLPSGDQWARLATDLPQELGRAFPYWPVVLVLVVLMLASPSSRTWLRSHWWVWVLFAVPTAFGLGFLLTVDPEQKLFPRYFFTWVPVLGIISAVAWESQERVIRVSSKAAVGALVAWMAVTQVVAFSTHERGDWQALSETIQRVATVETYVLVDNLAPLGEYRPYYYGQPRYLPDEWRTDAVLDLIRDPRRADLAAPFLLGLSEVEIRVAGWRAQKVDNFFTIYTANNAEKGLLHVADGLSAFSSAAGADRGATLGVAAAALYSYAGRSDRACEILTSLRSSADMAARLQMVLESTSSPLLRLHC